MILETQVDEVESMAQSDRFTSTNSYEQGSTTGEPIAAVVFSTSQKSGDYGQFTGLTGEVRPGHTDLVKYHKSQGFVDVRGWALQLPFDHFRCGRWLNCCLFLAEHFGTVILSSIVKLGRSKHKRVWPRILSN